MRHLKFATAAVVVGVLASIGYGHEHWEFWVIVISFCVGIWA